MKDHHYWPEEKMYRHIVEASNEGIWTMDKECVTTYVNTHMAHMLGYKQEEMIGKNVSYFMFAEELADHNDKMKIRILGKPQTYERVFRKKDGTEAWMIVSAVPIFEDEGNFAGSFAMFTDITERKKIEKKLKQSEERLRLVLENVNDGVYVHSATPFGPGTFLEANRRACNMLGYTREEFLNMTIADIDVPEQKELVPEIMDNIYKNGYAIFETEHITKYGKRIPVEVNTKIFEMEGKPVILSVVRDITERKKAEEEIVRREKKLKGYIDNAPDGIFVKNQMGFYIDLNPAACSMTGYSKEELLSMHFTEIISIDDIVKGEEHFSTVIRTGRATGEFSYIKKDGTRSYWIVDAVKLDDEHFLEFVKDVTEYRKAEVDRHMVYNALNASLNEIYIFDSESLKFKFVSKGALNNLGYTLQDIKELTPLDLKPEFNINIFRNLISPLINQGKSKIIFETKHKRKDGTLYPVEVHLQLLNYRGQKEFLAVILDITERKKLSEQLLQSQKMESVGRLAGGIAHDFNNMLGIIMGYGEILQDSFPFDDPRHSEIEAIINTTNRARDLTRQLLAFARKQIMEMKLLDINKVIMGFEQILRRTIRENIQLEIHLKPLIGKIHGDAGQIEQILLNLALNAQDAIDESGNLIIETSEVFLDEEYAKLHEDVIPGNYIMMAVSDTGMGMDRQIMEKIFEPFFTTKEMGRGTGLGLSTTYGIVKQHGGHILVYSERGNGSTFKIYFPCEKEYNTSPEEIKKSKKPQTGTETILVVEDEEEMKVIVCNILKHYGYNVLNANCGEKAIEIAKSYENKINLLLADVVMPDINGRIIYENLIKYHPDLKVLYMSGYTGNTITHLGVREEGMNFIQKPFTILELTKKIRKLLE